MSAELAPIESAPVTGNPAAQMIGAKDIAKVTRETVRSLAISIGGSREKYLPFPGWQVIAAAAGCTVSAGDVQAIAGGVGGVMARGRVIRASDGAVIAEAIGIVGNDEPAWAKRPLYARYGMAQTRAAARAARNAFGFILTLIDKNLCGTPAEEVSEDGFRHAAPARSTRKTAAAHPPAEDGPPLDQREEREARPLFGRAAK